MASQELVSRPVRIDTNPPTLAKPNPAGQDVAHAVKDMVLAGVVALGLFGPVIGLLTDLNMDNQLILSTRWGTLAVIVAIVMAGRLLLTTVIWPRMAARRQRPRPAESAARASTSGQTAVKVGTPAIFALVVVYPFLMLWLVGPASSLKWIDNFGVQILIYVMLGWGLNIVVGLAGLLDLGYVAFYAVGAYTYGLLATHFGLSFWTLLPLAGLAAAVWGMVLGFPVLRLRGDYLAIVTLAFGEIIRIVLTNWVDFSNGSNGVAGIPRPTFFGLPFTAGPTGFAKTFGLPFLPIYRNIFLYYLILVLALITAFVTLRLRRLPVGRAWEALREDEIACRSLGINTTKTKLTAFATGAMFGGFAGAFFATRTGFIQPDDFVFTQSAMILAIVVLGGMGSLVGVVIASVVMIGGTELMREMDFLKQVFGNDFDPIRYRMLLFGLGMVLIMLWKPRGLISTRTPTAFLRKRVAISGNLVKEGHG